MLLGEARATSGTGYAQQGLKGASMPIATTVDANNDSLIPKGVLVQSNMSYVPLIGSSAHMHIACFAKSRNSAHLDTLFFHSIMHESVPRWNIYRHLTLVRQILAFHM
jgi:hypothetical protein